MRKYLSRANISLSRYDSNALLLQREKKIEIPVSLEKNRIEITFN